MLHISKKHRNNMGKLKLKLKSLRLTVLMSSLLPLKVSLSNFNLDTLLESKRKTPTIYSNITV